MMNTMNYSYGKTFLLALLLQVSCEAFQLPTRGGTPTFVQHLTARRLSSTSKPLSELPFPPSEKGFGMRFRDFFGYLKNPDHYIFKKSQELGPIFEYYQFLRKTVVVGGQANVREFIRVREAEANVIYPALPRPFLTLHTKWGALNLDSNDELFRKFRSLFRDVLSSPEALTSHVSVLEPMLDAYVNELVQRIEENPQQEFTIVPEVVELCLQMFAKIFSGQGLSAQQVQMFVDYNAALLTLSEQTGQYKKAKAALDSLKEDMWNRYEEEVAQFEETGTFNPNGPGQFYFSKMYQRKDFQYQSPEDSKDRISSGMVLMIWGAYVECASLMTDTLALVHKYGAAADTSVNQSNNEYRRRIQAELADANAKSGVEQGNVEFWTRHMPYTTGVVRETLRLEPPGAGVPRFGTQDFELGGYRIPAGVPVMLDPRIGNRDDKLYPEPNSFEPLRWTTVTPPEEPAASSTCPFAGSALKLGPGSWFPGGNGAHKCPGVPLAEIVACMFVAKLSERVTWRFSGSGLTKNGAIDYVSIPVKILPDKFGFYFDSVNAKKDTTVNPEMLLQ